VAFALSICVTDQPSDKAAPRNPAASGGNTPIFWPNSGMNASVPRPNANATTVTYTHRSGDRTSNATFGSTLARPVRSCRRNQATSTTPTTIADAVAMPDTMLARLTAATAAVSSTSDPKGIGVADGPVAVRGIARTASATSAKATAASTAKASRHAPSCPNRPPTAGPRTLPTPHIADTSAPPRAHSRCGNARWISAYPSPASRPPPRP